MKTFTKNAVLRLTIGVLFTTASTANSHGQTNYQHLETVVAQSALIVEGEVTATECFWDENHTRIYTSNLVEVKTKMKGEFRSQFIEVLTVGGQVGDDFLMVSHNVTIGKGWKGLLFLNKLEVEGERTTAFRSSANPSFRIWDRATYCYDRINPPAVFHHSTVKDIVTELLQPVERFVGQPIEVYDPSFQHPSTPLEAMARDFIESIELAPSDPETAASTSTTIEYLIDNPEITGTWPKFLEFDLKAKCNVAGTEFAKGEIWVNYNIDAFGPSIVGSGYLTWTEESFLAMGDYVVTANDEAVDKVKLKVDYTGSLGLADLNHLPEVQEALLHLKLRVDDISQMADISFDQGIMDEKSKYRSAARADTLYPYDIVIAVDEQEFFIAGEGYHDLSYRFENETVVEINGEHWFEAEVMAQSDSDGVLLAQSVILIDIDETVFAPIQTVGNWEMIAFGLSTAPNVVFDNELQVSSDLLRLEVSDTLAEINELITYPPVAMYLTQSWQPLYKLRIKIDACNQPANLSLNDMATQNSINAYWIPNSLYIWPFEPISAIDTFNVVVCPDSIPVIYSVSPKVITAGTFDTLTINGANFGNTIQPIFFENADKGPNGSQATWIKPYDQDLVWTDSIVKIGISAAGNAPGSFFTWGQMPGSGVVRLDIPGIPLGSFLETEPITIKYGVFNARFPDTSSVRYVLMDDNGYGGYTFQYDSLTVPDSAKTVFDQATLQWNCATKVNFELGNDVAVSSSGIDGINSIRFAPSSEFSSGALAKTAILGASRLDTCIGNSETFLYVREIDITFNASVNWHFDTQSESDTSARDMLRVALHELGHAHLLGHVLDSMNVVQLGYGLHRPRVLQGYDVEGGLYIMDLSTSNFCTGVSPMDSLEVDCNGVPEGIDEFISEAGSIFVWPNPFTQELTIRLNSQFVGFGYPEIRNVLGQQVYTSDPIWLDKGINEIPIDASFLVSGIYFLKIKQEDAETTIKIIKE